MRPYICCFNPSDVVLRRVEQKDAYEVTFDFEMVPAQFQGQPDEAKYIERESVTLTITGPAWESGGFPSNRASLTAILYWHAIEALKRSENAVLINADNAQTFAVDPDRIEFPPKAPFEILRPVKMGFHT